MAKVKDRPPEEVRDEYKLHDEVASNPPARKLFDANRPELDETQRRIVDELDTQGYSVIPVAELLSPHAWEELAADAAIFSCEMQEMLSGGSVPTSKAKKVKVPKPGKALKPGKDPKPAKAEKPQKEKAFLGRRYKRDALTLDSPWLRLAASNRLLDVVNTYLEMWTKLSYADQWYSPPRGSEADRVGSMRWHRDYNDQHLVKVFTYLVDVDEGTGPFEFVPGSARNGPFANEWPWQPLGETYPPQDEFAQRIPATAVKTFTAPRGTMILCNTSGFHRGGFATEKPRDIWVFNYVSPAALESLVERNFPMPDTADELSEVQRFALT
jgi:hypothetical protein